MLAAARDLTVSSTISFSTAPPAPMSATFSLYGDWPACQAMAIPAAVARSDVGQAFAFAAGDTCAGVPMSAPEASSCCKRRPELSAQATEKPVPFQVATGHVPLLVNSTAAEAVAPLGLG